MPRPAKKTETIETQQQNLEEESDLLTESENQPTMETPSLEEKKESLPPPPKFALYSVDGTLEKTKIFIDGKRVDFSTFLLEVDSESNKLKLNYTGTVEVIL